MISSILGSIFEDALVYGLGVDAGYHGDRAELNRYITPSNKVVN